MQVEHIFLLSVLASVALLLAAAWRRSRLAGAACCFTGLVALVTLVIWSQQTPPLLPEPETRVRPLLQSDHPPDTRALQLAGFRPGEVPDDGYVTSDACRKCHIQQHTAWHESYHRTMTQVPTPGTAIGDFSDRSVTVAGRSFRFQNKGDLLWVKMNNPDDEDISEETRVWCPIVLSTGSHHMQIYWYPAGQARLLSQVPLVFLAEEQEWVPRRSVFLLPPGEPIESEAGRWNETCISCHTTRGRPRIFDAAHVDSLVTEFGISCEACHGPGERHVRYHESANSTTANNAILTDSIVNPQNLSHELSSQVCGQCHGVTNSLDREQLDEYKID
ncbi:MAG TPA: multiheme c-type cytochrome, partial [Planctomycetaceae bacterium]|nr:multiheme c-type cytochrome [Planctomycetaceae bacterium]